MGSGHSSRRNNGGQRHQNAAAIRPPVHPWMAPPPGYSDAGPFPHYTPYYYHHPQPVSPHVFQQGYYIPANAPYVVNQQHPGFRPPGVQDTTVAPPPTVPAYQKATSTVRNDVNLNKATLRLERDEANPEHHLVAFSFDATAAGSISIFFMAQEECDGRVASLSTLFPEPRRFHFKSGLGQKFKQETGLDFSLIDEKDLSSISSTNIYPLVIRIETLPKDPPPHAQEPEPVGGPLRKWIHCQQTYATIEKKDAEYNVKVVKQIIWVDGKRYELQEIYGIASGEVNSSSNDAGKECVICMSEPKDTTVLPCRHMCMCSGCANVLRYQTNLCPICRCLVEELLQIKVGASVAAAESA